MNNYIPEWSSLEKHQIPQWFDGAKLGIFIHWGLYSVPQWATQSGKFGEIEPEIHFQQNPYAEWYQNTLRIKGSSTYHYHKKKYGEDFKYEKFADLWKAENWNPKEWAQLFKDSGAKYVVLTTMHHDGFNLWPSKYNSNFSVQTKGPKRDIVGELTNEVRNLGIKMGHYYSGALNWRFTKEPIQSFNDVKYVRPQTYNYADYAYSQVKELIDLYRPDILWNDIGWPDKGLSDIKHLFAYYYNLHPEGVVNDRWHIEKNNPNWDFEPEPFKSWCDFTTEEYSELNESVSHKWESTRGMGYSFGFNRNESEEEFITLNELITLLIDVVSKNGNLLLNVGPKPDGTIPDKQRRRLLELGEWMESHGEAIYDTKPWVKSSDITNKGVPVRFTQKENNLYIFFLDNIEQGIIHEISLENIKKVVNITTLKENQVIDWSFKGNIISIINKSEENSEPYAIKLEFE
ncbi:alpha-L-fucosidase [Mammaliicoccus lentus]|uniref:alpha-L-fucosidase n=1 Tax=Mammaliicoccus lentus TaxID=42858 RepID=UPI00214C7EDB|nr:alpha-L-fucosidase [Mammaliicoccus lentus]MCR1871773.1 alpha-L-fucosidase [Mammaliicoccus lentus]